MYIIVIFIINFYKMYMVEFTNANSVQRQVEMNPSAVVQVIETSQHLQQQRSQSAIR